MAHLPVDPRIPTTSQASVEDTLEERRDAPGRVLQEDAGGWPEGRRYGRAFPDVGAIERAFSNRPLRTGLRLYT
jgi:hypothetical protein